MYGQGDAPFRRLYVDESGRYPASPGLLRGVTGMVQWVDERTGKPHRGLPEPQHVVAVPSSFNMDSIAYNTDVIKRRPEQVSWAELLNSRWKGRVALFGGGQPGLLDAANAAEAAGLMRFRDKGDMSRGEIDRIVKILVRLKKSGHFYGLWDERTSDRAVEFMLSRQVAENLPGAFGDVTIRKGQVRDGGSFRRRVCRYACWNSIFREHAYQERRCGGTSCMTPFGERRAPLVQPAACL